MASSSILLSRPFKLSCEVFFIEKTEASGPEKSAMLYRMLVTALSSKSDQYWNSPWNSSGEMMSRSISSCVYVTITGFIVTLPVQRVASEASRQRVKALYSPLTTMKLVRIGSLSLITKSLLEGSILSILSRVISSSPGIRRSFAINSIWNRGN